MRLILLLRIVAGVVCLAFLSSCATSLEQRAIPVGAIPMNDGAGISDFVLIGLDLDGSEDLSFILDTGSPVTILDNSLAQKLGEPTGSGKIISMYGTDPAHYYKTPALYLGGMRLQAGPRVLTWDMERISAGLGRFNGSSHRLMGILGMDCLKHYCLELDFAVRTIRFIDSTQQRPEELGKAYRLNSDRQGCPTVDGKIANVSGFLMLDTGCIDKSKTNVLGLDFLARHVITFDFPKRVMYLRPTKTQPDRVAGTSSAEPFGCRQGRVASAKMDYQANVSRFVTAAREFCSWVEGTAGSNELFDATRLVSRLGKAGP